MNLHQHLLPSHITLADGRSIALNTSHKIGLYWWVLLEKQSPINPMHIIFPLLTGEGYTGHPQDGEGVSRWLNGNRLDDPKTGVSAPVFSLMQDYAMLWALFMEKYHIDIEKENIHWHHFLALFDSAISGVNLAKVVEIRAYKPRKEDSAEYRQQMCNLVSIHALKVSTHTREQLSQDQFLVQQLKQKREANRG